MPVSVYLGKIKVEYTLVDIREFEVESFLRSGNPGDYALAMLARGGTERLDEILAKASRLPEAQRAKVLARLVSLSGLRQLEDRLTMEMNHMGIAKYVEDHKILREIRFAALEQGRIEGEAKGKAEGEAKGKADGMSLLLQHLLESKFGALPKWARTRVENATPAQVERWAKRVLSADAIEQVIGKRQA